MNEATQATLEQQVSTEGEVLYMAIEMGEKKWKLGFSTGEPKANGQIKVHEKVIEGSNYIELGEEIRQVRERFQLDRECRVVSCYEAGQDGFWPHRRLTETGIDNRVVDSASIEVNRRKRRAKTDALDVRKLVEMLVRSQKGGVKVWKELTVPSIEEEDNRRLHRELEQIKKEEKQHRTRIRSLLKLCGIRPDVKPGGRGWREYLESLKEVLLVGLWQELRRETERLALVKGQITILEGTQEKELAERHETDEIFHKIFVLSLLRGIGAGSAWLLVMEFFGWRRFKNRRQVAGCAGLDPTPYDSGESRREQGISKAGNKRIRWLMVELAWCWLRYQPNSELSLWFKKRFGVGGKRQRRIGIVALARRLLVALWRYVDQGVVPAGAELKA